MDTYSRFCRFFALRDMYAETISAKILDHCCMFGFPRGIFSDDASNISSALSRNIFSCLHVSHSVAIPYRHNPSMVERIHFPLKKGLSILCNGAEATWPKYLNKMTYALNTTPHGSIGCTPMEAFFFRQNNPQPNFGNCTLNETCDPDLIEEMKELRILISETSVNMKSEYISRKNRYTKECPVLTPGEKVMLKREAFEPGINRKMQEIRSGPWKVVTALNSEITISLIEDPSIIRRRHISHLAPFIERPEHLTKAPPIITHLGRSEYSFTPIEPSIITGDFKNPTFLKPNAIIIIGTECMLRTAAGLAKVILNTFPYGSIYSSSTPAIKPSNDELLLLLRKRPSARREPGKCILKKSITQRKPGPIIANLTIQYCPGKAIDNLGIQKMYLQEHGKFLDAKTVEMIGKDNTNERRAWFNEALIDFRNQLYSNGTQPSNIYIPKNIACGYAAGLNDAYENIIRKFSATINPAGFNVIRVRHEIE